MKIRGNKWSTIVQRENLSYERLAKTSSKIIYEGNMVESCRNLLNKVRSFTFLVEDNEGLINEALNALLRDRLHH